MSVRRDVIVTWPKSRTLRSYLRELERAAATGLVINYHVARPPATRPERCYLVYDGEVIGYNDIIAMKLREVGEVKRVDGAGFWPPGWYIVRDPEFHEVAQTIAMKGFQGWRWFDRTSVGH